MQSFSKQVTTFLSISIVVITMGFFTSTVFAAGNISNTLKYSQFINNDLDNNGTDDFINWNPTNGGATVSDTGITGYIWGETVGWIHLNPTQAGVTNTCNGNLGGYAWGENAGWVNFEATNANVQPNINTSNGNITGQVWSQNYGWIELSSPNGTYPGLNTTWRPSPSCDNPPPIGAQKSTLKVHKQVVGGNASSSDFILSVKENEVDIIEPFAGSPLGNTIIVDNSSDHTFIISEPLSPDYTANFSGDCNPLGTVKFDKGMIQQKSCIITNVFNSEVQYACKDPEALNYNPDPIFFPKNNLCLYKQEQNKKYGCTDPDAINYVSEPDVISKNNLCEYEGQSPKYGCKDPLALNYNSNEGVFEKNSLCSYPVDLQITEPPIKNSNIFSNIFPPTKKSWWPMVLGILGILSTIPGITARLGNAILTFVWGRKKIQGVVYDSVSKEPLDPVYVSVINIETNQEIKNQFTDMEGRFGFVLPKGHYKITAGKTHYQFPSVRLSGRAGDEVYDKLYFGEPFTVENEKQVVTMNIPMDPMNIDWNQKEKHKTRFLQYLVKGQTKYAWIFEALFILGFLASVMITYFYPLWWNYVMTGLYVVLSLVKVYGHVPIYAGKITKDGKPLVNGIIHIWSAALNREVAKRVTENSGLYYILVPKDDYYMTIDQRNPDGSFTQIFKSGVFKARGGVIHKSFDI